MARPRFVQIPSHSLDRLRGMLGDQFEPIVERMASARQYFRGRAIWDVNSNMRGGGVAEMLRALLPYVRGAGIDTRWIVLRESKAFFAITKRLHNNLHGDLGDGGELGPLERRLYETSLAASVGYFDHLIRAGDVVVLHDPQTAGLVPRMTETGATVIWRCHIGADRPSDLTSRAQDFLLPYVKQADAWVFSRDQYAWPGLDAHRSWTMAPSIDPFSPKNQDLDDDTVLAILGTVGLIDYEPAQTPSFARADGTPGRVERRAEILQEERLTPTATMIAQVSRWDRLKDHVGLLTCFTENLSANEDLHLVLAGPATGAVADDPEGEMVWGTVRSRWRDLPETIRRRIHLANLPMDDLDENGVIVNAIQRRADIVIQKSLAEGFGLTVAEAMWKSKPVVASAVGGIQDQVVNGVSGLLVDPTDLQAVADAITKVRSQPELGPRLGRNARQRVREQYLGPVRLAQYAERLMALDAEKNGPS